MMISDMHLIFGIHGMKITGSTYKFLYSIIIPIYNEQEILPKTISSLTKIIRNDPSAILVFVDDGSNDKSKSILKKFKSNSIKVITHVVNEGYGSALKTGIKHSKKMNCKYALFMDSDLTNDPKDIPKFKQYMKKDYDIIKANRYGKKGAAFKFSLKRLLISYFGRIILLRFFSNKIQDPTNGFRAIKLSLYEKIKLYDNSFSIIVEELFKFNDIECLKIKNIPVVLTKRDSKIKSSSFKYDFKTIFSYAKFILKMYK